MPMFIVDVSRAMMRESKSTRNRPSREHNECHEEKEAIKCQAKANSKTDNKTDGTTTWQRCHQCTHFWQVPGFLAHDRQALLFPRLQTSLDHNWLVQANARQAAGG